jgi:hypothetical protein
MPCFKFWLEGDELILFIYFLKSYESYTNTKLNILGIWTWQCTKSMVGMDLTCMSHPMYLDLATSQVQDA